MYGHVTMDKCFSNVDVNVVDVENYANAAQHKKSVPKSNGLIERTSGYGYVTSPNGLPKEKKGRVNVSQISTATSLYHSRFMTDI